LDPVAQEDLLEREVQLVNQANLATLEQLGLEEMQAHLEWVVFLA
jgi:hypothetical protein